MRKIEIAWPGVFCSGSFSAKIGFARERARARDKKSISIAHKCLILYRKIQWRGASDLDIQSTDYESENQNAGAIFLGDKLVP